MKLLFDNNLSHKLVARVIDDFPGSTHVMTVGLDESEDLEIWKYAKNGGFTIITKGSDYNELSIYERIPTQNHPAQNRELQDSDHRRDHSQQ